MLSATTSQRTCLKICPNDVYKPLDQEAEKREIADYSPETNDAIISAEIMLPFQASIMPTILKVRRKWKIL
jgi:hypothetical protein